MEIRLRTKPWIIKHEISEQVIRIAHKTEIIDLFDRVIADAAATLRGHVLLELLDNRPINLIGDGNEQEAYERCERLAVRLMEKAEQLRKGMR